MNERGGVQGRVPLLAQELAVRDPPQLVVQEGEQAVDGLTAAAA